MNFEPVLKGAAAVVSFFRNVFWETWGVLGTNLTPGTHEPLVSVEAEGETSWRRLRHRVDSSAVLSKLQSYIELL